MGARRIMVFAILAVFLCGAGIGVSAKTNLLLRLYDEFFLDSRDHFLGCDELPTFDQVQDAMRAQKDTVEQIKRVNPGFVFVDVDTGACPGKADIVISYGTHRDRLAIEQIVKGDRLFGIPYRLRNQ